MHRLSVLTRRSLLAKSSHLDQRFTSSKHRRPDMSHPAFWYEDFPIALVGRRQSPIGIETKDCILNSQQIELPPLNLSYPRRFSNLNIRNPKDNTYFGWRTDVPYDFGDRTILSGGPLNHRYKLIQFHAHWGKDCHCGSEHIIDGKHYSAELHFVHWNSDLYSSPREAAIGTDGLAVVAVFLEVTEDASVAALDTLSRYIPQIKYKGDIRAIKEDIDLQEMLPKEKSYWTYLGSLTTPPLWETVTWIIFEKPIQCRQEHIDAFRNISYYRQPEVDGIENDFIINVEENFRPIQPLNGRNIIFVRNC